MTAVKREEVFLFLDTSSDEAVLKIFKKNRDSFLEVSRVTWDSAFRISSTLAQNVKKILDSSNLAPKDLSGLLIYPGPGSFTGIRAGISFANAFSFGLSIPIYYAKKDGNFDIEKKQKSVSPRYQSEPKITKKSCHK